MSEKKALTDHPIQEFLSERWSPYAFKDRSVSTADLCSLFEATRSEPKTAEAVGAICIRWKVVQPIKPGAEIITPNSTPTRFSKPNCKHP